jgi:hypothetical protein
MAGFKVTARPIPAQADSAATVIIQQELTHLTAPRNAPAPTEDAPAKERNNHLSAGSTGQPGIDVADAEKNSRRLPAWKEVANDPASGVKQSSGLPRGATTSQKQNGYDVAGRIDDGFHNFGRM